MNVYDKFSFICNCDWNVGKNIWILLSSTISVELLSEITP